ncbi:unnamed protein product [Larinioides sclopetarius]|uniref:Uncharacterized protein n=1 Tax=Larinioides sclopetarius TaxID=280406 RepID=A0AAV1ZLM5_9ARAC
MVNRSQIRWTTLEMTSFHPSFRTILSGGRLTP